MWSPRSPRQPVACCRTYPYSCKHCRRLIAWPFGLPEALQLRAATGGLAPAARWLSNAGRRIAIARGRWGRRRTARERGRCGRRRTAMGRGRCARRRATMGRGRCGRRRAAMGRGRWSAGGRSAGVARARRCRSLPAWTAFLDYRLPSAGQQQTPGRVAHTLRRSFNVYRHVACSFSLGWSSEAYKAWE